MLLLLAAGPVFELPVMTLLVRSFAEVADDAAFGLTGSQAVLVASVVTVLLAATALWNEARVSSGFRRAVGIASLIAAGLLATLAVGFLVTAEWAGLFWLLAHCIFSLSGLGGLAIRSAARLPLRDQGRR
ncbi:hypothetical protein AWW66_09915 [Micromonospora rosaria]|uniref:Uncharacterized protein n=1 Tax=Micromonospora rosaria TaxID=47874 RepID=A0A136PUS5_9ACTN|nr:hypothetical protein [Micromonospora rosaria]KXK62145.1 hypothetical protein AWW66_09915 [Micromonospora rosaria]